MHTQCGAEKTQAIDRWRAGAVFLVYEMGFVFLMMSKFREWSSKKCRWFR